MRQCVFSLVVLLSLGTAFSAGQASKAEPLPTPAVSDLCDQAYQSSLAGENEKSLALADRALNLALKSGDTSGRFLAARRKGEALVRLHRTSEGLGLLNETLEISRSMHLRRSEGGTLGSLAQLYQSELHDRLKAVRFYNLAILALIDGGDPQTALKASVNLGELYSENGENRAAMITLKRALSLCGRNTPTEWEVGLRLNLAQAYQGLGLTRDAITVLEHVPDRGSSRTTDSSSDGPLGSEVDLVAIQLSMSYLALGEYDKALARLNHLESQIKDSGDSRWPMVWTVRGLLMSELNERDAAQALELQALKRLAGQTIGPDLLWLLKLNLSSLSETGLHSEGKSITYGGETFYTKEFSDRLNKTIGFVKQGQDPTENVQWLTLCAQLELKFDKDRGLDLLLRAQEIAKRAGLWQGDVLEGLGLAFAAKAEPRKAADFFLQALGEARHTENVSFKADVRRDLARVRAQLGSGRETLKLSLEALQGYISVGDRKNEADTLLLVAKLLEKDNPGAAAWHAKQAINVFQSLRGSVPSSEVGYRESYRAGIADKYREAAALLVRLGRLPEAEQVLRLIKDEELSKFLRRGDDSLNDGRLALTEEEQEWNRRYEETSKKVAEIGREAEELRNIKRRDPGQERKYQQLLSQLDAAQLQFDEFINRLLTKSSGRVSTARLEKIGEAESIADTLRKLPEGTVAVYTLATDEALRLILVTPSATVARTTVIGSEALSKKIAQFRLALQDPTQDCRALGKELYDLIIAPIEGDLIGARAKTIMWSLDGSMRYLPIAALWDGKQYFLERYDSSLFNPSAASRLERDASKDWKALGAGVSQPRSILGEDGSEVRFSALPGVPDELSAVWKTIPGSHQPLLDKQFTAERFQACLDGSANVIHLATHFAFRPGNEATSFIVTGEGKPLRVADARAISGLKFQGITLLTLSACETALGGQNADGTEVEGIAAVLQKKGAEAVLATLWSVADESTQRLMSDFYSLRKGHPEWSKLHALKEAQIRLLKDPEYTHPYFWAPFVLQGNWK